jgi:hypothetical protein
MTNTKTKFITGTVRTNKVGSDCTFDISEPEYWATLTPEEQQKELVTAMWEWYG